MSLAKVAAVALPLLLILCSYGGDTKPLFGLGTLLSTLSSDTNGTSILAALALAHAQHTIDKLEQLAELLNATTGLLTS